MSAIPSRVRKIVHERSNDQCSRCGNRGSEIHHRQRRREAGHAVGNCVLLCSTDHKWAHANPVKAKADGYIVPPWEDDASAVPIKTFAGWATFDNEGGITFVDEQERDLQ